VRVNPDFELKSSGMKMGGGPKQFGVDAEVVPALLSEIVRAPLRSKAFHIYSGSQNLNAASICDAQRQTLDLACGSPAPHARRRSINIGGGFGIPYFPGERPLDLAPIGENLAMLSARLAAALPDAHLVVVSWAAIWIGEAGIYICRVIDRKISRGHVFLVTDGGLHHHPRRERQFRAGDTQELSGRSREQDDRCAPRNRIGRRSALHAARSAADRMELAELIRAISSSCSSQERMD
jgi:diaminopimelate decarboxylase